MKVSISAYTMMSCLGDQMDQIASLIGSQELCWNQKHRLQQFLSTPLGELDFNALGVESPPADGNSLIFQKILTQMVDRILDQSKLSQRVSAEKIGFFLGCTTAGVPGTFSTLKNSKSDFSPTPQMMASVALQNICKDYPIGGITQMISSACSSGALALKYAHDAVASGMCDAAIGGGFDLMNTVTVCGFDCLQVISQKHYAPFSEQSDGIRLADGGALVLFEKSSSQNMGVKLVGSSAYSEAYHPSTPNPDGSCMLKTMELACEMAQIEPTELDYINAHGTGTRANDIAENHAIQELGSPAAFDSTKTYHGHTLGGSGALEATLVMDNLINPERWQTYQDRLHIKNMQWGLSNSFGFGGNNASLVFART